MAIRVDTTMVHVFGNSVLFGDSLNELPMMFQPILFYPDWLFMTWPAELFFSKVGNGSHPYLSDLGPVAIGWSIVWCVGGVICGFFGTSETFTEFVETERPLILNIPLRFLAYLLFWHIVIARIIGTILTRFTTWNRMLTEIIYKAVYVLMLTPPVVGIVLFIVSVFIYLVR